MQHEAVARRLVNDSAAFIESCVAIGLKDCVDMQDPGTKSAHTPVIIVLVICFALFRQYKDMGKIYWYQTTQTTTNSYLYARVFQQIQQIMQII